MTAAMIRMITTAYWRDFRMNWGVMIPTPDIITMLTVSFPMFLLYELSIVVASRVHKKRTKADKDFYNNAEKQAEEKRQE